MEIVELEVWKILKSQCGWGGAEERKEHGRMVCVRRRGLEKSMNEEEEEEGKSLGAASRMPIAVHDALL